MINFGFISIGQGGCNIVNTFAKEHNKVLAINTAQQDLEELNNIANDLKIKTQITTGGGAGKNPALGEYALKIKKYRNIIKEKIELNLNDCDLIWVVSAFGGGTGSLGASQLISILSSMGKYHGLICALPINEDTLQKRNALLGIERIIKGLKTSDTFNPVILLDNNKLKNKAKNELNGDNYEKIWDKANEYIFNDLNNLAKYSNRASGSRSFDPQDYKNLFKEKGTILFTSCSIPLEDNSDKALYSAVSDSWNNNTQYMTGDIKSATGMAVIVERPNNIKNDGKMIDNLYNEIKNKIEGINLCEGVYKAENNKSFFNKNNSKIIKVHSLITGLSFPDLNKFKENTLNEYQKFKDKKDDKTKFDLGLDINSIKKDFDKVGKKLEQDIDLSVFDDDEVDINSDELDSIADDLDWSKLDL